MGVSGGHGQVRAECCLGVLELRCSSISVGLFSGPPPGHCSVTEWSHSISRGLRGSDESLELVAASATGRVIDADETLHFHVVTCVYHAG